MALHKVLLEQFIASRCTAPDELVLYIDATHIPLDVFCGEDMLACVLRPSSRDPVSVCSALIQLIAKRLRQA